MSLLLLLLLVVGGGGTRRLEVTFVCLLVCVCVYIFYVWYSHCR